MPLSALMALWASGKGMQAITNGLNTIYHVKETRNWLMTRIYSAFYMLLFVLAIIVTLLALVLGNRIQSSCTENHSDSREAAGQGYRGQDIACICRAVCSVSGRL